MLFKYKLLNISKKSLKFYFRKTYRRKEIYPDFAQQGNKSEFSIDSSFTNAFNIEENQEDQSLTKIYGASWTSYGTQF
jgi:hypothetical protein